jgi:glycosyltransferase involved in cell wall biosynthesis
MANGIIATRPADTSTRPSSRADSTASDDLRLLGKRVGMVMFSSYPADPRPRRAVDALIKSGARVELICLKDEKSRKREALNGVDVCRISVEQRRGGKFAYAYQYSAFILISAAILAMRSMKHRYDLVYVHNMPDILVLSALIPKALGAKVILDLHDPMPELMTTIFGHAPESGSVRLIKRLEKWSLARANLVLTVNIACKRIFGSRSCPPEKIGVVMNSPAEEIFPFRTPRSYAFTNHDPRRPFVIMYHGSLVERNGVDLAVEALARVRESIPFAELRIYGQKTAFLERVMEQVHGRGLQENVHYLGGRRLEDLVREIEDCDVGVIPNQRNAFTDINTPTRIFEYLALGKPVIAPRTMGIQDYFGPESLIFFESGNAEDLAQRIKYVFSHPDEILQIAERGQQVYLAHTWSQERQTLVNLVSELLPHHSG